MKNLKNNKAFTIIELLVVIAILGILVLLAGPRLLGYVEKAKLVQIKHDVKAAEQLLAREYLAKSTSLPDNWVGTNPQNSVNNIYDTRGPVNHDDVEPGDYKLFPKDEIGSKLPGDFHAKDDGKVYYEDKASNGDEVSGGSGGNNNDLEYTDESQFEFIEDDWGSPNSYIDPSDGVLKEGYFKYIGTDDTVVIPHTLYGNELKDYYYMFNETSVSKVVSDNPNITNMSYMFYDSQATSLDLSSFDTSNVTTMDSMFSYSQATSLDLSSFDTSNVTDMGYMFSGSEATILDLSNFNTFNVTKMRSMFSYSQATSLDLSSFNTFWVTDMRYMFYGSQATSLDLSSFSTFRVTDMRYMFYGSQATSLDLSSFDTSKVANMDSMFSGSKATAGYAKTQSDADRFNASSGKPDGLTFVVKE